MEGAGRYHDQRGWALGKQQRTQRMDHLYLDCVANPGRAYSAASSVAQATPTL